jgi:2-phospho-L-lactate guanylyltransferase (CobY/MobA/RfbA family)
MIRTGLHIKSGRQTIDLDDPQVRQRYAETLSAKQRERFAQLYVRQVLEAKDTALWFNKMLTK